MASTDVKPGVTGVDGSGGDNACTACRHSWNSHDSIARRYCTATMAGGVSRGCVCAGRQNDINNKEA
ncbi:RGCVC family protein [Amycolatopsis sp. GM8]|uniref:RGCVC family protein n=1 Tax=Amycolatopsis sp. GM8 TaxID=2896530 RepID=UPI001F1E4F27|nr:RGCVC family protein [Amycolatopsis sp. GM8]